jgi:hypothetical protein
MDEVEKVVLEATRAVIKAAQQRQRAVAATPPA